MLSTEPSAHWLDWWLANPRDSPVSTASTVGLQVLALFSPSTGAPNVGHQPPRASISLTDPSSRLHMLQCCLRVHHLIVIALNVSWLEIFFFLIYHALDCLVVLLFVTSNCTSQSRGSSGPATGSASAKCCLCFPGLYRLGDRVATHPVSSPASGATSCAGHGKGHQHLWWSWGKWIAVCCNLA